MARSRKQKAQSDPRGSSRRNEAPAKKARRKGEVAGYEFDEEAGGIGKASLRRGMRYVIISFLFLLIAIGAYFGTTTLHKTTIQARQNACWTHQQEVQALARNYMVRNNFASLPAYIEDVPGSADLLSKKCPSGGEYTWEPVNGTYTCSEHGAVPDGFNKAQSVNLGTSTTITNTSS